MKKRIFLIAFWFALFLLVPARPAWAYIDPATTTYLIQIVTALIITLGVSLSIFLYRFQIIITNIRVMLHAFAKRISGQQGVKVATSEARTVTEHLSEEEALAAGLLDYPIPVCENYPALAPPSPDKVTVQEEAAANAPIEKGWLHRFGAWLLHDERKAKQRLPLSLLIAGGLAVTYLVFPMLDSLIMNASDIPLLLNEALGIILLLGLLAFIVLTLFLVALRGRLFDLAICVTLSFLVCGYLQITFFNSGIGQLIGTQLGWEKFGVFSVVTNLLIWLGVFALIIFLGLIRKARRYRFFRQLSLFVPALIITVQFIALLSIFPFSNTGETSANTNSAQDGTALYLTWEGITEVSANENIIVIILDTFDMRYVNAILAEDPGFFDSLDGFTFFTNNMTVWNSTYPAVINYMTAKPYEINVMRNEYTEEAYAQRLFVEDIRDQGFSASIYMDYPHSYCSGTQLVEVADNLRDVPCTVNVQYAIIQLCKLNLLKLSPLACKNMFWIPPDYFNYSIDSIGSGEGGIYQSDDLRFFDMVEEGLQVVDEPGHFAYIHLRGSHAPYIIDAQGKYIEDGGSPVEQTKGCFLLLDDYLRQLKELGLYKDATIIITGDHPEHVMHTLLFWPSTVGLFVKPSGAEGTPLQTNNAPVTIDNMRATCVAAAGGDTSAWGKTYFEVAEDESAVRYFYHRYTGEWDIHYTAVFRVTGDASDWNNWELVEQIVQDHKYWF
ncbi:MAG: LTA synthase family protein [Coriobacteriia bacterium]|nr:LTA synthase family protein [Coriobacteriia bacterium]